MIIKFAKVQLERGTASVQRAVFSPDGTNIITTGNDNTARIWDVETGKELQRFEHAD